jgi:hypothetical protein
MNSKLVSYLFGFKRELPNGYPTKVNGVTSKYTPSAKSGQSTISTSVVEAVEAWYTMSTETDPELIPGGVGSLPGATVAELNVDDKAQLIVIDNKGKVNAVVRDSFVGTLAQYDLGDTAKGGAAIILALMPELLQNDEFEAAYNTYVASRRSGDDTDVDAMAMMSDNAYRRIVDGTLPESINLDIKNRMIPKITDLKLQSGGYAPDTILVGKLPSFSKDENAVPAVVVEKDDFVGKYNFHNRVLSATEQLMVPKLEDWYVIPESIILLCKHIMGSVKGIIFRTFLMRGAAGTGKTLGVQALAAGIGLPYTSDTYNPETTIFDAIGQLVPVTQGVNTPNLLGDISFSLDDLRYAPEMVYESLTGQKPDSNNSDISKGFIEALTRMAKDQSSDNSDLKFRYVESGLVQALRYGWVCEIREPSVVTNQGVLVGLNSMLEENGEVVLPITGERFKRHPDAVVVLTTNTSYEGCRNMNQSVLDRMDLILDEKTPPKEVMVQRAMAKTGEDDETLVEEMADLVIDVSTKLKEIGDTSGEAGMRSLISWIKSTQITNNPYDSALLTLYAKATTDEETRELLKADTLDLSSFALRRSNK